MSIRVILLCGVCSTILGYLFTSMFADHIGGFSENRPSIESNLLEDQVVADEKDLVPPTDFYLLRQELVHSRHSANREPTEKEISPSEILPILMLSDADLLADLALAGCSHLVTPEKLLQAKLLAREFEKPLKELRRKRSEIMEQLGVTFDEVDDELRMIRSQAWKLVDEVRTTILREVFSFSEREQILAYFKEWQERVEAGEASLEAQRKREADVGSTEQNIDR